MFIITGLKMCPCRRIRVTRMHDLHCLPLQCSVQQKRSPSRKAYPHIRGRRPPSRGILKVHHSNGPTCCPSVHLQTRLHGMRCRPRQCPCLFLVGRTPMHAESTLGVRPSLLSPSLYDQTTARRRIYPDSPLRTRHTRQMFAPNHSAKTWSGWGYELCPRLYCRPVRVCGYDHLRGQGTRSASWSTRLCWAVGSCDAPGLRGVCFDGCTRTLADPAMSAHVQWKPIMWTQDGLGPSCSDGQKQGPDHSSFCVCCSDPLTQQRVAYG